jgi:hypothetical protein
MKMPIGKLINVPLCLSKQYKYIFKGKINLQGPFKHDSAKTSAARTSTCLSVNRLSVADVIRLFKKNKNQSIKAKKTSSQLHTFAIAIIFNNRCE